MGTGITLCFLGAISFGLSACVSKIASRQQCNAPALVVSAFGWAAGFMLVRSLASGPGYSLPGKAVGVAVGFGVCAAVAIWAFQVAISVGKVTVAWLVMNLSAGVPAMASIWIYRESLTLLRGFAFVLALIALACLFMGKRQEDVREALIAKGE